MSDEEDEDQVFGYDSKTGKEYMRIRRRKPNRYQMSLHGDLDK